MGDNKIRILIVDDNKNFADILCDYLETNGNFEVVGKAGDGLEALSLIRSMEIDLIVLDLIMPRLDGIGVLEEMNLMALKQRPKVVVLTAIDNDIFIERALNLGGDFYINKPFDIDLFMRRISELISCNDNNTIEQVAATGKYSNTVNVDIDSEISELLRKLGTPVHIKGYKYLKEAIAITIKDISALSGITTVVYPSLASKYNSTTSRVERAIRYVIEVLSKDNKTELWRKLFISTIANNKERPTNLEFIGNVSDYINLKIKNSSK